MMSRNFAPGESTEVEIRFEAVGQDTRVTIENRGWERFAKDHAVRHGLDEQSFIDVMSVWWADVLVAIKNHIGDKSSHE